MVKIYNEDSYEQSIIELFQNLGYTHYYGPDVERDYKNPLFKSDLENLYSINSGESRVAIENAVEIIQDFGIGSLIEKNEKFFRIFKILKSLFKVFCVIDFRFLSRICEKQIF